MRGLAGVARFIWWRRSCSWPWKSLEWPCDRRLFIAPCSYCWSRSCRFCLICIVLSVCGVISSQPFATYTFVLEAVRMYCSPALFSCICDSRLAHILNHEAQVWGFRRGRGEMPRGLRVGVRVRPRGLTPNRHDAAAAAAARPPVSAACTGNGARTHQPVPGASSAAPPSCYAPRYPPVDDQGLISITDYIEWATGV